VRLLLVLLLLLLLPLPLPALALTPAAQEFIDITARLEPVQCEKRQLRRKMALAMAEQRGADLDKLNARFAELNRDRDTARLEQRLAELEKRISAARDPADLDAISLQQRQAFYRCE
jgi:hypothetical protein